MSLPGLEALSTQFKIAGVPGILVDELLGAFLELKRRFYLNDFRPNAVEGGRFSEAAFRVVEWSLTGAYTPLGDPKFKTDAVIRAAENKPYGSIAESLRIHIPRTLRVIYDIRNKRDAGHLADGIDPNVQDASLVVGNASWVLAELVRLFHVVDAGEAQATIDSLVTREVPAIEVFAGKPRLLKDLKASDLCLALLYWHDSGGCSVVTLRSWLPAPSRPQVRRTLSGLHDRHLVHLDGEVVFLTGLGRAEVEDRRLVAPAE